MAAKNSIKQYLSNSYYHLYNRGVEKRKIFLDKQDYKVFLSYIKEYLTLKDVDSLRNKLSRVETSYEEKDQILKKIRLNNFYGEITLLCYCLMENHFHLLIKQFSENSIDRFMNSLCLRYSMYFNRKYNRVGKLFQGVYKAVLMENDEQLLYLTKYIHLNPFDYKIFKKIDRSSDITRMLTSQPSSYLNYLGKIKQSWVLPKDILAFLNKNNPESSYQSFIESSFIQTSILNPKYLIDEAI